MPVSLLIGNGFNRVSRNQPSWEDILSEIAKEVGKPQILNLYKHKPETLTFEQLAFADNKSDKEDQIKQSLAVKLTKQESNDLHEMAVSSGFRHILTTNYDYNFEDSVTKNHNENRERGSRELKYSLFRKHQVNGTSVWHIHGEVRSPATIMLGYEHYAGSIQNLRAYMTAERSSDANKKISQFKIGNNAFDGEEKDYSWLDVFFRDDIHIIGLSLNFTEADLWWAITYKQKLRFKEKFHPGRTIYHYMPASKEKDKRPLAAKLEVLSSLGVEPRAFDANNEHEDAYRDVLRQIRGH